jgi:hypothetical protein
MIPFPRILVEPLYRVFFGRPLEDAPPFHQSTPRNDVERRGEGLVLVADGIGGLDLCGTALRYVMAAEGLSRAFHMVPWGHGFGRWLADLTDVANRDRQAVLIAQTVRRFREDRPDEPVFLVAKSGGSGVIVKALEHLTEDTVERAIFLSPALSPRYDLTAALRAVRLEMVVFWSPLDLLILGAGTWVFGTVDRVRTASAGMVGFSVPADGPTVDGPSESPYSKLRQIRWGPRMVGTGYLGGHVGPDSPVFLKKYVVPLLRSEPASRR